MTNADYGIRIVPAKEIIAACGSPSRALAITGGIQKIALFYVNNVHKIATADEIEERDTDLARELNKAATLWRKTDAAADAYNLAGTLSAIMAAVPCGHPMARDLLQEAKARGLIREPATKSRTPKCSTPKATKPAEPHTTNPTT